MAEPPSSYRIGLGENTEQEDQEVQIDCEVCLYDWRRRAYLRGKPMDEFPELRDSEEIVRPSYSLDVGVVWFGDT